MPRLACRQLGSSNVGIRVGDGSRGWAEHAPFDKILVDGGGRADAAGFAQAAQARGAPGHACGSEEVQLLTVIDKDAAGQLEARELIPVRFSRLEAVM